MKALVLAVAVAAAAMSEPAASSVAGTAAAPRRCTFGSLSARIGGRRVCLNEGAACRARYERQYRRHAFTCRDGSLDTYWRALRRPFRAPPISAGEPCPTTSADGTLAARGVVPPFGALPAWGRGPAYPTGLGLGPQPLFQFEYPPQPGSGWEASGWGGSKNIWVISPSYGGPVLVRGRQLDGPNEIRFENGRPAFTAESALHPSGELRLHGPETYGNPSTTRLRAAGCYAFQIDGRGFTYAIVFEARIVTRAPAAARRWTWRSLHRRLHVPRIEHGAGCPISLPATNVDFARYGIGRGLGAGPAYPIFGGVPPFATLDYVRPQPTNEFAGSAWGGQKVLWFVHPRYRGPVLIRGRRLDGRELVRFDRGILPPREIRIAPPVQIDPIRDRPYDPIRERASYTRLRAPGCYGYQLDGLGFSRVVVFRARVAAGG